LKKKQKKSKKGKVSIGKRSRRFFSHEYKLKAVKMVLEDGCNRKIVSDQLGCCMSGLSRWILSYQKNGPAGLSDTNGKGGRGKAKLPKAVREQIVEMKQSEPELGSHKISGFLKRLFFMKASHETVRKVLHEESLLPETVKPKKKAIVRRSPEEIENGQSYVKGPHLMWQSDISQFTWQRQTVYLIGFIDDYSRFVTGMGVYLSQKTPQVLETFRRAVMEYQAPKEMLTDNGRQYATWRGRSEFEKEMTRAQIRHITSRPHHPQTQGKIERFWKTIKEELLTRTIFSGFEDLQERVRLWVQYYNFRRPHQGIGGLCPADRYYEVAQEVRRVLEQGIADNILQMALLGVPRKPCYLVGRMDNQSVTVMAEQGQLRLQVSGSGAEKQQEISYPLPETQTKNNIIEGEFSYGKGEREDRAEAMRIELGDRSRPLQSSAVDMDRKAETNGSVQGSVDSVEHTGSLAEAGNGRNAAGVGASGEFGESSCIKLETPASSFHARKLAVEPFVGEPYAAAAGSAVDSGIGQTVENRVCQGGIDEIIHEGVTHGGRTGEGASTDYSGSEKRQNDSGSGCEVLGRFPQNFLRVGEERFSRASGSASEWGRRPSFRSSGRGERGLEEGGGTAETGIVRGPGNPPCPAGAGCLR